MFADLLKFRYCFCSKVQDVTAEGPDSIPLTVYPNSVPLQSEAGSECHLLTTESDFTIHQCFGEVVLSRPPLQSLQIAAFDERDTKLPVKPTLAWAAVSSLLAVSGPSAVCTAEPLHIADAARHKTGCLVVPVMSNSDEHDCAHHHQLGWQCCCIHPAPEVSGSEMLSPS